MAGRSAAGQRNVLVMGVSASGKTTVGRALAARLGLRFVDADDHHPPANVEKMTAGVPLDDDDRRPWLATLADLLEEADRANDHVVLACSALKEWYRRRLAAPAPLAIVFLDLPMDVATARVGGRADHFLPSTIVPSQFEALEPPVDAIVVDATAPVPDVVEQAVSRLSDAGPISPDQSG